ncbi:MAG: hypothetical protein L0G99_10140 [Propionibacteriales bacterium]|nr:hypothetical protein [Propionibacteriales bacterium]
MSEGCAVPYLMIDGAATAIDHYVQVFGAVEVARHLTAGGEVERAELALSGSHFLVGDPIRGEVGSPVVSPDPDAPTTVSVYVTVEDVDALVARITAHGSRLLRGPAEVGARREAVVIDPFRHVWIFADRR